MEYLKIGPYAVEYEISDSMQQVLKGYDPEEHAHVAIKLANPDSELEKKAFTRETKALLELPEHPNIVPLYDIVWPKHAIILPYLKGRTLKAIIESRGAMSIPESKKNLHGILAGLSTMHTHEFTHRDIKPENIMINNDGAHLLDFGLTYHPDLDHLEEEDEILGTPHYMSPEMCIGSNNMDHRQDIYSLGVMMFEMLTGVPPYTGRKVMDVIQQHFNSRVPAPSDINRNVPTELSDIVVRATMKDPRQRYMYAEEMALDLAQVPDEPVVKVSGYRRAA
jgi:serine/threonine-protein kinase